MGKGEEKRRKEGEGDREGVEKLLILFPYTYNNLSRVRLKSAARTLSLALLYECQTKVFELSPASSQSA